VDAHQTSSCQNGAKPIFYEARIESFPETNTVLIEFSAMTMDQSLKVKAGAIRARNVLTRAERVARLKELDKFDEKNAIVGMPKVRVQKVSLKKKKKVKKAEEDK
jgi:small basic protein (TIGR04137 family)